MPLSTTFGSGGTSQAAPERLPLGELARLVRGLQRANPWIFWSDLILSVTAVWIGLAASLLAPSPYDVMGGVVAICAVYRTGVFIHELVHLRTGELPGFSAAWHLAFGIPFLMPAFLYGDHRDHHATATFGTAQDNEYLGRRGWRGLAIVVASSALFPISLYLRALILVPLSVVSPRVRDWTDRHASGLRPIGVGQRPPPAPGERRSRALYSAACAAVAWLATFAFAGGLLPPTFVGKAYVVILGALSLNAMRLVSVHRYASAGRSLGHEAQFLDSVNFEQERWLSWWWAPVGLHLHALHHLFPSIPYHNLPKAHRVIAASLPADSLYHRVGRRSLVRQIAAFLRADPMPT